MLHSYYLKAFRHHGQKAVKQLCEKEINEEIKGIFEMNKMFNKNICLKRCFCMYFADNQWVLLIANIFNISSFL